MPTAGKCGATSATSIGRARKPLSCVRKPAARRQEAEQPPVDCGEAERNQAKPHEVLRRQSLIEEQAAQYDSNRRHEQGDKKGVCCARRRDQPEIEHVAERGAKKGEGSDCADRTD